MTTNRRLLRDTVITTLAGAVLTGFGFYATAATASTPAGDSVCREQLPPEADGTMKIIQGKEKSEHEQDGTVFQNREGILPEQKRGYYHEFTVETPGIDHRGAKRIVTGGEIKDKKDDYYTNDHYESFEKIDYKCEKNGKTPTPDPETTTATPDPDSTTTPEPDEEDGESAQPSGTPTTKAPDGTDTNRVQPACYAQMNQETKKTLKLIQKHGDDRSKFPHPDKDGSVFEWREYDKYPFPKKKDGYYREWTVPTPGEDNRGRQRIVTGGDPKDRVEDFYTPDHYDTFQQVDYGC